MNNTQNTATQNINLLSNMPEVQGVDNVIVGELITKIYGFYTYNAFISNYWGVVQAAQNPNLLGQLEIIPSFLRSALATECIKNSITLAQTVGQFDWNQFMGSLNQSDALQGAGQNQRRAG